MKNLIDKYLYIVFSNLKYYKFRTFIVAIIILIISGLNIFSKICIESFENGIENVTEKMGADIIIAPDEYTKEMQNLLFTGEPSTITFDKELINDIDKIEGIEKLSEQLLLATLNSSCCTEELQVISINIDTDFTVKTWDSNFQGELKNYEMIIGSNVNYEVGDSITFYGKQFDIVGKLDETGMGYDRSVFINKETGRKLLSGIGNSNIDKISLVLIKTEKGVNLEDLCVSINNNLDGTGLSAYKSREMYSTIVSSINKISDFIKIFEFILLFISLISIFSLFTITIDERRREFATYDIIGVPNLVKGIFVILEAIITCIIGAFIGIILAIFIIIFFSSYIEIKFQLPFINLTYTEYIKYGKNTILIAIVVGITSSCYSAFNISRSSYNDLKEGR